MSGKKHWKATGVVMNRLKAVLSGDAEVYLSVFDTKMTTVHHAGTPAEARELVKKFAQGNSPEAGLILRPQSGVLTNSSKRRSRLARICIALRSWS